MKTCNCPGCGAEIGYDENRDFIFCQECGTKIMFGPSVEKKATHTIEEKRNFNVDVDVARIRKEEAKEKMNASDNEYKLKRNMMDNILLGAIFLLFFFMFLITAFTI